MPITTGVLFFDDMEELDFAGPWEALSIAKKEGDRVVSIAERSEPVRAGWGTRVVPDHTFADAPPLDVLVVPGGLGTRREVENPVIVDWIKSAAADCTWVTSVCTGAFLLHQAGLLAGRKITTHWAAIEELRGRIVDDVTVLEDIRYVRDGNVVTAAGVSAGIDMSLWLVGQIYDIPHARAVASVMEYDPAPPYRAEV
jgi:transcriptional regulator GlxA family with amidase domain